MIEGTNRKTKVVVLFKGASPMVGDSIVHEVYGKPPSGSVTQTAIYSD